MQTKPYKNVSVILSSSSSKFSPFVLLFNLKLKKIAERRVTHSVLLEKPGWQALRGSDCKASTLPAPVIKRL